MLKRHPAMSLAIAGALLLAACAPAAAPAPTAAPAKPTEAAKPADKPAEAVKPAADAKPAARPAAAGATAAPAAKPAASPAAAQPAAKPADMTAIYEEAKKEGSVVWFTTVPVENLPAMKAAFEKRYPGVTLEPFRGTATSLVQKFETEYRADQNNADVFQSVLFEPVLRYKADGWILQYDPPEAASYPANAKDPGYWYFEAVSLSCLGYNTNQVKGSDVPTDYTALLDPKWKGAVGTIPPWASGNGLEFNYYMTFQRGLADWGVRLATQEPKLYNNFAEIAQGVVRGEIALAGPMAEYEANNNKKKGAPVDCVFPSEVQGSARPSFISAKAKHPNAAKLLMNWRLSEEGQKIMQDEIGWRSIRPGMPPIEGLPSTDRVKVWYSDPQEIGARQKEFVDTWQKLFGR